MVAMKQSQKWALTESQRQAAWNATYSDPEYKTTAFMQRSIDDVIYADNPINSLWRVYEYTLNNDRDFSYRSPLLVEAGLQWSEREAAQKEYKSNVEARRHSNALVIAQQYVDPYWLAHGESLEQCQAGEFRALSWPMAALQEDLHKAAKIAAKFARKDKFSPPILHNIRIESACDRLKITATNLEATCIATVGAKIEGLLDTTIPAALFRDLMANLPDERVDMYQTHGQKYGTFTIECCDKRIKANIKTTSSSEFPRLPIEQGKHIAHVYGGLVKQFKVDLSSCIAGTDEYVKLTTTEGGIQLTGHNKKSITQRTIDIETDNDTCALMPVNGLKLIASSLDKNEPIDIYETKDHIRFVQFNVEYLVTKLAQRGD